ncbi:MAG: hypothetical protein M3N46_09510 [Actinomycetota bacterium]|nr:hypothetical protein [Actinomycetota bacterium]
MTNISGTSNSASYGETTAVRDNHDVRSAETKSSFKTTELIVFIVVAVGIMITAGVVGHDQSGSTDRFQALQAAQLITALAIGYMVSRGLAKSGSRQPRN